MIWVFVILIVIGAIIAPRDDSEKDFDDWLYNEADDDEW